MARTANLEVGELCHLTRLSRLASLSEPETEALRAAAATARTIGARKELGRDGGLARQAVLLSGWGGRVRQFPDGRRQILQFLLPGDLIEQRDQDSLLDGTSIIALTEVSIASVPSPEDGASGLARAYAISAAMEQAYLFRQIARVGRLDAYERLIDLMLELHDRLRLAGLADGGRFSLPLTQEMLADGLGLTSVHVNRTLQLMRREGVLELRGSTACLVEPERLGSAVDYQPVVVSAPPR